MRLFYEEPFSSYVTTKKYQIGPYHVSGLLQIKITNDFLCGKEGKKKSHTIYCYEALILSIVQYFSLRKTFTALLVGVMLLSLSPTFLSLPSAHAAGPWYNQAWMYRKSVTVHNPNNTPLTNYQTRIDLDGSDFPFAEALPNGADLRFTDDTSSTVYSHWLEKYDQLTQNAWIWVKIPSIPANGDVTLEMYYGNALAPQASDGNATFSFFDDFDDQDISDWTYRLGSPGPYFVRGNPIFLEDGKVAIREAADNYGYIKKSFSGSLQGKVVESLLEYGHPSFMNGSMGADAAPRLTVVNGPATQIGVGPVGTTPNVPETQLATWSDGSGAVTPAPFSYTLGDRVVNRISFKDSTNVQLAVRNEDDATWDMQQDVPYAAASVDNGSIALGKLPLEEFNSGGGLGTHQWDWVRVRSYADAEPTFTIGSTEAETLLAQMQLSSSMPGRIQTQYTFTVTPNQPIPNGGSLRLTFPTAFNGRLNALTPSSITVAPHAQITSVTPVINAGTNTITLTFSSSADIVAPMVITIGDNAGAQGDIRNPITAGPHTITLTSFNASAVQLATSTVQMAAANWWDDNWQYRHSLHVNNVKVRSALDGYQVQVNLNNTNFDFSHTLPNGADLRFVTPQGVVLPYWLEYYDQPGEKARVWVKMNNLPANTETMLFIYYGNSLATNLSNGSDVFQFFDDFSDADISDWTTYSATPGAITTIPGKVQINEEANNRAYLRKPFTGSLNNVALEGVLRYLDSDIGESFHPHLGFYVSDNVYLSTGPVRFSFGTLPTDTLRYWASGPVFDDPGGSYTTNQDIDIMINTAPNYYIVGTKLNEQNTWDAQATKSFNTASLAAPQIQIGKYAYDYLTDLNFGPFARHTWTSLRVRDFVYFEPLTLLGGEETNILPSTPDGVFINTASAGANTNAVDPLAFTTPNLAISAIFHDDNALETGTHYDLEVASDAGFTTILATDTFHALTTPLHDGDRSEDLTLPGGLPYNTDLYVRLRFYDSLGQISPASTGIHFYIHDAVDPSINALTPTNGATNVATNTPFTFQLRDAESGLNTGSLNMNVNGVPAIVGGVCQTGFSCGINPVSGGEDVTVSRTAPFAEGSTVTASINIQDMIGNTQTANTSFTIIAAATTAPVNTTFTGGGGGFSASADQTPTSTHPSAPQAPTIPTFPNIIQIPQDLFHSFWDSVFRSHGNACSVTAANFNYTLALDAGDFAQKVHFLEKFGVNFSQSAPRRLHPEETVTRSQMLKYLLQLSCADFDKDVSQVARFPDVPPSHPDDFYILLGRKYGLVNGYLATGLYAPDQFINMAEALKITIRAIVSHGQPVDGQAQVFRKVNYSQWYGPDIRFATDKSILRKEQDFDPAAIAQLSDVVDMMVQAIAVR